MAPVKNAEEKRLARKETARRFRENNPEKVRAWRQNRDRVQAKEYAERHRQTQAYADSVKKYKVKQYGLTIEEYDAMLAAQEGCCALCHRSMEKPHIDHDHNTGQVRGLLCPPCNWGLGQFEDDTDRLLDAVAYLRRG